EAGVQCFERALELEPSHAVARQAYLMALGVAADAALEDDAPEEALEICRRQLEIDANYTPALMGVAEAHFALGQLTQAEEALQRMIALHPDSPQVRVTAGAMYLQFDR